jgi:hypothetical protein
MYEPTGYYAVHDDSYALLCPHCAAEEARDNDLDLENPDHFAAVWSWNESDTLEFCENCYERIDLGLTTYGIAELRERVFENLRTNDLEKAAYLRDILAEYGERIEAYAYGVARIGYSVEIIEVPFETYNDAARAMFDHFKTYPPELIECFNVESDPDTGEFFDASIDFYGGTYAAVIELEF